MAWISQTSKIPKHGSCSRTPHKGLPQLSSSTDIEEEKDCLKNKQLAKKQSAKKNWVTVTKLDDCYRLITTIRFCMTQHILSSKNGQKY